MPSAMATASLQLNCELEALMISKGLEVNEGIGKPWYAEGRLLCMEDDVIVDGIRSGVFVLEDRTIAEEEEEVVVGVVLCGDVVCCCCNAIALG